MSENQQKLTAYHARARYYLTEYVETTINAPCPHEALEALKRLRDDDDGFWDHARSDCDDCGNVTFEIMKNRSTIAPLAIEAGHELAPDGATDLLRELLRHIRTFDEECQETGGTDTGEVWQMLHGYERKIAALLGTTPVVAEDYVDP